MPLSDTSGVYDFGKITAGWAKIKVTGKSGLKVSLKFGEQLNADGTVYIHDSIGISPLVNLDTYIVGGASEEIWEPDFTRHGFRYVQVEFSEQPSSFDIQARVAYSDLKSSSEFETSNTLISSLYKNQKYTEALNLWGVPTDTSWRDRSPWMADVWLYMDSVAHNFDINLFYRHWIDSVRQSQLANGAIGAVGPDFSGLSARYMPDDPSWAGTYMLIVWNHYQLYGDASVVSDNYDSMKLLADALARKIETTGYLYSGFTFGDWSPPHIEANNNTALFSPENPYGSNLIQITANGDLYHEFDIMKKAAELLGHTEDATRYADLMVKIKSAFNDRFLDTDSGTYSIPDIDVGYRQTSNLVPLAYGMVPDEYKEKVYDNLVADIQNQGVHLNTGATGTRLILPVLSEHGDGELAYSLLTQTTYPSWGYWISQDANTSWETWSITGVGQAMSHAFLGTYQDWLYKGLAGINSAEPGYKSITLKPVIPNDLPDVKASVKTPHGTIGSSWYKSENKLYWSVTIPDGIFATIYVPRLTGDGISVQNSLSSLTLKQTTDDYTIYTATGDGEEMTFISK